MKITLISVSTSPADQGLRTISSVLKKANYKVNLVFMKLENKYEKIYSKQELLQLKNLCKKSGLVGVSSFASTSKRAIQIIKYLKKNLSVPIIWGGVHPTLCPEECIKKCDIICRGEGEEVKLELAEKIKKNKQFSNVKNLWIRKKDKIIKNEVRNLVDDLDTLPFPDYSLKGHFLLNQGKIQRFKKEDLEGLLRFLTNRGCPYGCDYCSNSVLNDLYLNKRKKLIRYHSIDYIMDGVHYFKDNFPKQFTHFSIQDDVFFVRPLEDLNYLFKRYKEEIGLPIKSLTTPSVVNDEKIKAFVDAGGIEISMGIEANEETNRKIYHRACSDAQVINAAKILNKYKDRLSVTYDLLACCPYEEQEDILRTIKLLAKVPKPFYLNVCNLVLFPGTPIYNRAMKDGLIKNEQDTCMYIDYSDRGKHLLFKRKNLYVNLLLNLMRGYNTEEKYGLLTKQNLEKLTSSKVIKKSQRNKDRALLVCYILELYDFGRSKAIKLFLNLPKKVRAGIIRLKYGKDPHFLNLEEINE